jgi:hypothetical protein
VAMNAKSRLATVVAMVSIGLLGSTALSAQDKYTLQVPDGLAFSDFRGYESWEVVSVSQTETKLKVIVANPTMIDAYKAGVPGNGQKFPDGSRIAKIDWELKKSAESPYFVNVPQTLSDVAFIEKDGKRFPDTSGWGYAKFGYDAASDTFAPDGSGANCGYTCHTKVAAKDYIFHPYQKR